MLYFEKENLSEWNQECAELTLINHSQALEEVDFNKGELAIWDLTILAKVLNRLISGRCHEVWFPEIIKTYRLVKVKFINESVGRPRVLWFAGARGFRGRVGWKNIEERSNWLIGRVIVCKPLHRSFLVFPFLLKFALAKIPENIISLLSITKILDALTWSQLFGKAR